MTTTDQDDLKEIAAALFRKAERVTPPVDDPPRTERPEGHDVPTEDPLHALAADLFGRSSSVSPIERTNTK